MKNKGKVFEESFKKSVPDDILYYRFKDGTANWQHNNLVRFQAKNICDCMLYDGDILVFAELKNHKGKSIPFSCIRENQIKELSMYQYYKNTKCVVIINFEDLEECYCLFIADLSHFIRTGDRKSIPIEICREIGIKIENKRLRTNYRYDIKKMMGEIKNAN